MVAGERRRRELAGRWKTGEREREREEKIGVEKERKWSEGGGSDGCCLV